MENTAGFRTTLWTEVLNAGDPSSPTADSALARLCQTYWIPVYAFIRKKGHSREAAEDLVQGFFERFLEKGYVSLARRERGRFRCFLMTAVERYLHDAHDRQTRAKRGGHLPPLSLNGFLAEEEYSAISRQAADPASIFEKLWASTLLDMVLKRLASEYRELGKALLFDHLQAHLWGDAEAGTYAELSQQLGCSAVNLRVQGHRMRQRFREVLREEIAQTVAQPVEIDAELQHLMCIVSNQER
jgi:RNA polymerase sigma-70 factor (ECF subfamily)